MIRTSCVLTLNHALSLLRPQAGPSSGTQEAKKDLDVVMGDALPRWITQLGASDGGGDFSSKKSEGGETKQTDVDTEKDIPSDNDKPGDTKAIKRRSGRRKSEWDQSKKRWGRLYTSRKELLGCAKNDFRPTYR